MYSPGKRLSSEDQLLPVTFSCPIDCIKDRGHSSLDLENNMINKGAARRNRI